MKQLKEELTRAGIPYVSECLGGNIEGIRLEHNLYVVEHGSGEGYYLGDLEEPDGTSCTLQEVLELAKNIRRRN